MPGQVFHFNRKNARGLYRRVQQAAASGRDAEFARRLRLLQARATGNGGAETPPSAPLIQLEHPRPRAGWDDVLILAAGAVVLVGCLIRIFA